MKTKLPLLIICFSFMLLHPLLTFADDELYLCGIVQKKDREKNTVTIEVISLSCPGTQAFKLPDRQVGRSLKIDEHACFFIDSNQCTNTTMYTITKVEGE
ncbi:MAG: hypothetical protein FWG62_06005 [Proteobacteria bacterium]|nr:hypothetical protein [Pseudomonadota bacterium]